MEIQGPRLGVSTGNTWEQGKGGCFQEIYAVRKS